MLAIPALNKKRFLYLLLPLLLLPILVGLAPPSGTSTKNFQADKVNLALRRTAHLLLRESGDSTSRIPVIEQPAAEVWRLQLNQSFDYDRLPATLQASLDLYGVERPYTVAVRQCEDGVLDLGYHKFDLNQAGGVPCTGREPSPGCHFIDVTFLETRTGNLYVATSAAMLLLLAGGLMLFLKKPAPDLTAPAPETAAGEKTGLPLGQSRLDTANLQLVSANGALEKLTFREAKLLHLFATHPNQLLERDFLLQQVWMDEGILVGRSVDVFVSRLRKKLKTDPSVRLVAVHGVGYRLEVEGPEA